MYIIIYSCLFIITLFGGNYIYKSILNPVTIWSSWWSFIGIMSNLALFDYYPPSRYVNNIIIAGIVVYFLYSITYGKIKNRWWQATQKQEKNDEFVNYRLFYYVNLISIIIEIPFFVRAINTLSKHAYKLVYLRGVLTDESEGIISGGILSIIRDSGIKNVFSLSALYAAVIIFTDAPQRRKRQVVTLALIETIEYSITNAARTYVVNFLFYLLLAFFIFKRKTVAEMIRRNKKVFGLVAFLMVTGLILQNSRASDMSFLKTIYIYFCSGPSYLTRLLEDASNNIIGEKMYWGTMTFGFLANIYYYFKIGFTGINDSTVKLLASVVSIKQYFVGTNTYINAMCTCFYPFLADWGNAGIIIGPVVAAMLGCRYFKKMKKYMDIGSISICIYVFYNLLFTAFKWNFLYIDFSVILILNYLICPHCGQKIVIGKLRSNYE